LTGWFLTRKRARSATQSTVTAYPHVVNLQSDTRGNHIMATLPRITARVDVNTQYLLTKAASERYESQTQ
jgi:hypothetical protein